MIRRIALDTNDVGDYIAVYDGNTTASPYLGSLSYSSNTQGAIIVFRVVVLHWHA